MMDSYNCRRSPAPSGARFPWGSRGEVRRDLHRETLGERIHRWVLRTGDADRVGAGVRLIGGDVEGAVLQPRSAYERPFFTAPPYWPPKPALSGFTLPALSTVFRLIGATLGGAWAAARVAGTGKSGKSKAMSKLPPFIFQIESGTYCAVD